MGLEEWLPVKDFEEKYEVSSLGRVRNKTTLKILSQETTKDGYLTVRLYVRTKEYKRKMVHRLVAESFIPLPDLDLVYEVDHIDNIISNNCVENLQWLTHKQNLDKSHNLGNQNKTKKVVYQYSKDGKFIAEYESVNEAFRQTNIRHISDCACGHRKSAGGYIWTYTLMDKKEG